MQMDELTREFLIESQEGLDRMERCLTELEEKPRDMSLLAEIFRAVHTIKGTTGFLGFKRLETLAHAGENLLGLLREGELAATPQIITVLLELLDGLRGILKRIDSDGNEGEDGDTALIARLDALQTPDAVQAEEPPALRPVQTVEEEFALPARCGSKEPHLDATGIDDASPHAVAGTGQGMETAPARGAGNSAAESSLRVDVTLLNRMMNLVGELVLTRNQVLQATAADARMTMLSRRLDMVTADLREAVMQARLQPVSHVFSKMPRIVRDLSRQLGKRVRLELDGQETELDKSLLEAIKDPLTHAVRNALDHGIECPEERAARGKCAEGTLRLRAQQEGSHVIVEVTDDGGGIAVEKVRDKAIERGLITADRATHLNERELLQLIFLPGFSTAAQVTSVSGRGVGMDVVRTNVEKIGGKVEIDSRVGRGTTLRLRIPLTLAIIPALIVRGLSQSFALPQGALSELVHVAPEEAARAIEWIENAPLYRLRGRLLPLVFLDRLLAPGTDQPVGCERDHFIAVLDADGRRYGLVVDGLADPEEIVVKPLSAALKEIGLYSGATVLGNGELALILDPGAIAISAGITMTADGDAAQHESVSLDAAAQQEAEYLLVEAQGRPAAVHLADVLHIEQAPLERIESFAGRPVLQFAGQLLPIEDPGGVLDAARQTAGARIVVVVCRDGKRQVGIAVSHVLDVAAGCGLQEAGTALPAPGVTLLKERVTEIVNLSAVEPLPATAFDSSQPAMEAWQ
jgi:two-component system chemotaxis sensor kinase CheA